MECNSARQSVFSSVGQGNVFHQLWYCASAFHTKKNKNKTECSPFFRPRGGVEQTFCSRFWCLFPSRGTPGASRIPFNPQVGSQVDFLLVFWRPGRGPGTPFGPFGLPRASLGATLAVTLAPKVGIRSEKERIWCTLRSRVDFGCEKGGARTPIMWLNHSKYLCFRMGRVSPPCPPKVPPRAPKS